MSLLSLYLAPRCRPYVQNPSASVKRTRSTSVTSDRPPPSVLARDATPLSAIKGPPGPPSTTSTVRTSNARNKRNTGRKSQAQDLASVDGDEGQWSSLAVRDVNSRDIQLQALRQRARRTAAPKVRLQLAPGYTLHSHIPVIPSCPTYTLDQPTMHQSTRAGGPIPLLPAEPPLETPPPHAHTTSPMPSPYPSSPSLPPGTFQITSHISNKCSPVTFLDHWRSGGPSLMPTRISSIPRSLLRSGGLRSNGLANA